jgi:hypothetical protein
MVVLLAVFAVLSYRQTFTSVDDFNHWGLITKSMNIENRLPTFTSVNVFNAYQPGSALFIYFITRFISYGEGQAIFAQKILMIACIWPLLAFVPRKSKGDEKTSLFHICVSMALILSFICMLLVQETGTLLVDILLAVVGIGGFAVAYSYRKTFEKAIWLTLPFAVTMVLIKNSGMFFAGAQALLFVYYFLRYGRKKGEKRRAVAMLLCGVGVPYIALLLWFARVEMVFVEPFLTPHAFSITRFSIRFAEKTWEEVQSTFLPYLKIVFDVQNPMFVHFLLWIVVLLALWFVSSRLKQKDFPNGSRPLIWAVYFCSAFYLLYVVGLLGTFVFSMSPFEGANFYGVFRYLFTAYAYCAGVFVIVGLSSIQTLPSRKLAAVCLLALCVPMCQAIARDQIPIPRLFPRSVYQAGETPLQRIDRAVVFETRGAKTAVYCPQLEKEYPFTEAALRYKLYANVEHFTMLVNPDEDPDRLWETISAHGVLIVIDEDDLIGQIISEHWQERETYIGTYLLDQAH